MPLITPLRIDIEKTASATRLEKEPDQWPSEIVSAAYKQVPYISAFETDLELQRVDQARGYAVGRLLVYPAKLQKEAAVQAHRLIALPVIVRERELSPLDVYQHEEQWYPLVEKRVQEILYNPATFDRPAPTDRFGGTDLTQQTDPGSRQGMGGMNSVVKTASANMLDSIVPTFRAEHVDAFKERLREDTSLRVAFATEGPLRTATESLVGFKEKTAADIRAVRKEATSPTVIQFQEAGNGYLMKTANHDALAPVTEKLSRFETEKLLIKESMDRLRANGRLTMVVDPVDSTLSVEKTAQEANRIGVWSTRLGDQSISGVVIPSMVSLDGRVSDLHVFAGQGVHSMQEKVAGVFERDVQIPALPPRGEGVFVYQVGAAGFATEPVVIQSRATIGDKEKTAEYHGYRSINGEAIILEVVPGLVKIASMGKGRYAIPDSMHFLPLQGKMRTVASSIEDVPLEQEKVANMALTQLHHNGTCYWLSGDHAEPFRGADLDAAGAEFALGALGVIEKQAHGLMEKAASAGSVSLRSRPTYTEETRSTVYLLKTAAAFRQVPDLRKDLLKEAAILALPGIEKTAADKETVDAVLSLGFITPENVALYVDFLPDLEKVSGKLAQILVASRLGMDMVKENAARNSLTQLNAVIDGLQNLQARIQ